MVRYVPLLALVLGALLSAASSFGQPTGESSSGASAEVLWQFDTGG